MTPTDELTKRQAEVLNVIARHIEEVGYPRVGPPRVCTDVQLFG